MNDKLDHVDVCVIGAGVVGLAVAKVFSERGKAVVVLEAQKCHGSGISSRNSEVIHAGLYYPDGSLKAKLCVEGKHLLYSFCEKFKVPHRRLGKLVVAKGTSQVDQLLTLQQKAIDNGVGDTSIIDASNLTALEPKVAGDAALHSPSTGIVDCHAFMDALLGVIESFGGSLSRDTEFKSAEYDGHDYTIQVVSVGESYRFKAALLVNCAGIEACEVAKKIEGVDPDSIPLLYLCKGSYFALRGRVPFRHLIYPLPEAGGTGLGVHATLDLGGQVRFGPDTEYVEQIDYDVDVRKRDSFTTAIMRYFPDIAPEHLSPAYAGIRPKLQAPGSSPVDFRIEMSAPGMVNLYGIESPGLTASLAIGDHVSTLLGVNS
jgi:L-2-hydroxyglutarate oxidase LhgO